ncbi:Scarecrow-like protein 18 [Linum grandiflorum]
MLSSFNNSSSSHDPDEDTNSNNQQPSPPSAALDLHFHLTTAAPPQPLLQPPFHPLSAPSSSSSSSFASSPIQVRQLIVRCSDLISQADYSSAHRLISILSAASSPYGDEMMRSVGFRNVGLSPFAVSQAKLLLRLHYPSEGYRLDHLVNGLFLGWRDRPLFSISSWRA